MGPAIKQGVSYKEARDLLLGTLPDTQVIAKHQYYTVPIQYLALSQVLVSNFHFMCLGSVMFLLEKKCKKQKHVQRELTPPSTLPNLISKWCRSKNCTCPRIE